MVKLKNKENVMQMMCLPVYYLSTNTRRKGHTGNK